MINFLIRMDGLNEECIQYMPFLRNLRRKSLYVKKLVSVTGFGAQPSYLTGTFPNIHDKFAVFFYDPKNSPFKSFRFIAKFLTKSPAKISNLFRTFIRKTTEVNPFYIPIELLHNFNFNVFGEKFPQEKLLVSTLFDVMKSNGKKFKVFRGKFEKGGFDLAYILFYSTDTWGHLFGPFSDEFKARLKGIDTKLKEILENIDEKSNIILFSDHGMSPVNEYIDLYFKLKHLNSIYFLDSTMVRFWFNKKKEREKICKLLFEIKCGHILTEDEKVKYKINFNHNRYGDLIFWLDEGSVFSPDFFHPVNVRVKGMHGYLNPTHHGFLILNSKEVQPGIIEKADLIDIFPTLLKLMDLPIPPTNQGKILIK